MLSPRRFSHAKTSAFAIVSLLFALSMNAFAAGDAGNGKVITSEFIFETASFPSCHASTIVQSKGKLVAAWFGGTAEGHKDVGIWLSRHEGDRWSSPVEVATGVQEKGSRYPCWNPVLFQPRAGPLLLFYKVGPSPSRWWGMLMSSEDQGVTWSQPRRLPDDMLGPIKNKPIELSNGDILCPSSTENNGWRVHFETMRDEGKRRVATGPLNEPSKFGAIQPTVLVHPGRKLQALGRTRQGCVFEMWSDDEGATWGPMRRTSLPNPNSGIDAVTLRNGRHLLVYNDTPKGRTPLNVAESQDGEHWKPLLVLESAPGEYSYPAIIQTQDGLAHVTYTWKRQRIKHVVFDPAKTSQ